MIKYLLSAFLVLATPPAFAKTCDRLKAEDANAMNAITKRLNKSCTGHPLSERCTQAIEDGNKALAASNTLALSCPDVTWSYDPPPPWRPDDQ